jgi:hypothetical protein
MRWAGMKSDEGGVHHVSALGKRDTLNFSWKICGL